MTQPKPLINFLCIGAQKAGTTWLFENLRRHPEIAFPAGKEVHFWDMNYRKGLAWYRDLFMKDMGKIKGEITPAYAILPDEKIFECYDNFPDLKIIYLIRNPIERAWSGALMALRRAELRFEEASDQWFLDHFHSEGSLKRGDYETCLKAWLKHFPKEQFLVLNYEDIKTKPAELLEKICDFIGVNPHIMPHEMQNKKVFTGSGHQLRPVLKRALENIYTQEKAKSLEVLLQNFGKNS